VASIGDRRLEKIFLEMGGNAHSLIAVMLEILIGNWDLN